MTTSVPTQIQSQKYIDLATFRRNGIVVHTPVWFAQDHSKLYVMTRSDSGKYKRIRNNPQVRIAPCTIRGRITGPEYPARARILPTQDWGHARDAIRAKYWLTRINFLWSKKNVYLEIEF